MGNKKGLSPVIATVLLIVLVMILAAIIFMWARGFVGEQVQKFGEPIENICQKVSFEVEVYDSTTNIGDVEGEFVNRGNVPIYSFEIKEIKGGDSDIMVFGFQDSDGVSLDVGEAKRGSLQLENNPDEIVIYPMILGSVEGKQVSQPFTCLDVGVRKQVSNL